jgi:hypothetical protein
MMTMKMMMKIWMVEQPRRQEKLQEREWQTKAARSLLRRSRFRIQRWPRFLDQD